MASDFFPSAATPRWRWRRRTALVAGDETPEGRSIVVLAKERFGSVRRAHQPHSFVPFSATPACRTRRGRPTDPQGAAEAVKTWSSEQGAPRPPTSPRSSTGAGRVDAPLVADGPRSSV